MRADPHGRVWWFLRGVLVDAPLLLLSPLRLVRPVLLPLLSWWEKRLRARSQWSALQAHRIAILRQNARDHAGAERLYLEVLAIEPEVKQIRAGTFMHLGLLYESQGRAEEAARNYSDALRLGAFPAKLTAALSDRLSRLETGQVP